jgi:hypothetical protein
MDGNGIPILATRATEPGVLSFHYRGRANQAAAGIPMDIGMLMMERATVDADDPDGNPVAPGDAHRFQCPEVRRQMPDLKPLVNGVAGAAMSALLWRMLELIPELL